MDKLTMEEFINKYAKKDLIVYRPLKLKRGDKILVFMYGEWHTAMFVTYCEDEEHNYEIHGIIALPDDKEETDYFGYWITIKE